MQARITVVGGGVIGLSCAWQLAERGHAVTLVAPDAGHDGASWVAAGMLAPVTEVQFGESALTNLLLEAAGHWKAFAHDLERRADMSIGHNESGTLTLALDPSDKASLDDLLAYQHRLGCVAHVKTGSQCREMEPALSAMVRSGIEVPGDHQVDNRALLAALTRAAATVGVTLSAGTVTQIDAPGTVTLSGGNRISSDCILLAAGVGTTSIDGLEGAGLPEIRPVKGHILRLGPGPHGIPLRRTVRGLIHGRSIYLVPRTDGSVVVGATVEERGDDLSVQAGAIHQLLADARELVPGVDEMTLLESATGLRPATADNLPCIGWTRLPGVAVACGHYRNGMLLAPLTAATITALMDDQNSPCRP